MVGKVRDSPKRESVRVPLEIWVPSTLPCWESDSPKRDAILETRVPSTLLFRGQEVNVYPGDMASFMHGHDHFPPSPTSSVRHAEPQAPTSPSHPTPHGNIITCADIAIPYHAARRHHRIIRFASVHHHGDRHRSMQDVRAIDACPCHEHAADRAAWYTMTCIP